MIIKITDMIQINVKRVLFLALICCMILFIWSRSTVSIEQSLEQSGPVTEIVEAVLDALDVDGGDIDIMHIVRKSAHFAEFALLGMLVGAYNIRYKMLKIRYLLFASEICFFVALIDETIQIFANRGAQPSDVMLDFAGALTGVLLITLAIMLKNKFKKKR